MKIRPIHELTVDELRDAMAHEQNRIDNLNRMYPPGVRSEWVEDDISMATVWRDRYRAALEKHLSTGDSK
jgi:hypothetical protein